MARHRSNSEKARDRRRVAELYLKGWLQVDIAKELEFSRSTVGRDLVELQKQWLKSSLIDIDKAKARELARIDNLEREAWDAWQRSQVNAETVSQRVYELKGEPVTESKKVSKGQVGDPRYLDRVSWCIQQRCKILGLEAPEKHKIVADVAHRLPELEQILAATLDKLLPDESQNTGET